jgi:hypothetical protein
MPSVLELFLKVVSIPFFAHLLQSLKQRRHSGVFTLPVVIWLMIFQRLDDKGTLGAAVQQVVRGLPAGLIPRPGKRLRERTVSSHTGGYNQARQQLPLAAVEEVNTRVFEQLMQPRQPVSGPDVDLFILDGSTLLMPHTAPLLKAYPPSRNQHGESHWPILRILVGHHVHSGIATRPRWGPVHGPKAVSEQGLTGELMDQLPARAGVMGDQNFGVFSVAWAAQQRNRPVLLRLTPARAKRAFGPVLCSGTDQRVTWKPSRWDGDGHPDWPRDACVNGRLIVRKVYPSDGSGPLKLHLFTTLDLTADEILSLYGLRWNVETDLRTLKKTIRLEMLDCRTPTMVAKELILATTAYNLVRAVINDSAQRTGMDPRQYSFSRVQDVLNTWLPYLASIPSEAERSAELDRMMKCVAQCKLYKRKRRKSYPRAVWGRPRTFPSRKALSSQEGNQS